MKKLILLILTLSFALLAGPLSSLSAAACCKQRAHANEEWYENGLEFNECNQLNREEDGDDIYSDQGKVWWDNDC